jgi:hypothetical protein
MRPSLRILLIALPLLTTGCSSLFYLEAETDEVCKTQHGVSFPGAPQIPGTVSQTFDFPVKDISATLPTGGTDAQLRIHLFEVTATSGNPDLSGVERASVAFSVNAQSTPTKLLEYKRPTNQTRTEKLTATGEGVLDLNELSRTENLVVTVEASGTLPQNTWTADVRVCAGLWLRTDVLDLLF